MLYLFLLVSVVRLIILLSISLTVIWITITAIGPMKKISATHSEVANSFQWILGNAKICFMLLNYKFHWRGIAVRPEDTPLKVWNDSISKRSFLFIGQYDSYSLKLELRKISTCPQKTGFLFIVELCDAGRKNETSEVLKFNKCMHPKWNAVGW